MKVSVSCGRATTRGAFRCVISRTIALAILAFAALSPNAAGQIAVLPPSNVALPTIAGIAQIGQTLVAGPGSWADSPTAYAYQWGTCEVDGSGCSDIPGATSGTYLLDGTEVEDAIAVTVTATNAGGSASATSAPLAVSSATGAPNKDSRPVVTGTPEHGYTLTTSNGSWSGATSYTYQWRRCDSAGANCVDIAGATTNTYKLDAADVGKRLKSRVTAWNAAGSRSATSAATDAVQPDSTPPSVPDNMVQSGKTQTTITTSWSASTDYVGVTGYRLYKDDVLAGTTTQTTYTFTGLACGKTYNIGLEAVDAAGNASDRRFAEGPETTSPCSGDTTAPSTPTNLRTTSATTTSISVAWNGSTDNVGVAGYGRYRDGTLDSSGAGTTYTFSSLGCGTTYTLAIDAYDAAGNRSGKATVSAATSPCPPPPPPPPSDTTPPSTPTGLATSGTTETSITLSWNASTDNVGVTGYGRYRNGTLVSSGTGTSYTFSSLSCGTSYTLAVDAYDAAGNRSGKASTTASTSACPAPPPPPPPSGASVYLSPSGSDSNACTSSAPCRNLSRGYAVAQLGQTVELAGGSYGAQTLSGSKSGSGVVTFRPASGASVSVGDLSMNGQNHIEFQNMTIDNWYAKYVSDVTFRNVSQRFFFIRVSSNVRLLGGSVGPSQDGTSPTIGNYSGEPVSTNITIDGVLFHDIGRQNAPGAHIECLFLQEASGVVIRNSKFTRCDVMDLYVSPITGGITASNVTIENNWFDQPTDGGYYAFNIHPDGSAPPSNFTFRYNSVAGSIYLYDGFNYTNVVMDSNIGRIALCGQSGITYRYNVWTNQKCGTTDKVAPSGFVDESGFNLHLAPGSAAINAGNSGAYPASDIDGQTRPMGGAPDAGADEAS